MCRFRLLVLSPILVICCPPLLWAADADPKTRAASLVRELGHVSFEIRQKATDQLTQLGRPAKQALLDGAKDVDPEIRVRCERILEVVLDLDFKARVDAFIADKEGKQEHEIAGWTRYRKLVGEDAPARELFVEMLRAGGQLLEDAETRPSMAGDKTAYRVQQMMQGLYRGQTPGQQAAGLGDVAVVLFLGSDANVRLPDQTRQLTSNFLYQPVFRTAITSGPRSPYVRKIFGGWMAQTAGTGMAQQMLSQAMQMDIKEGMELALKLMKDKDYAGGMAITAVGKWGGKDQLPLLEPLLADNTILGNFQVNNIAGNTEIRDVALAMMVRLSGQQPKDYGFAYTAWNHNEQQLFYIPVWMGFTEAAKRDAAHKKWQDWAAAQKK